MADQADKDYIDKTDSRHTYLEDWEDKGTGMHIQHTR